MWHVPAGASEYMQPVEAMLEVAAFPEPSICAMSFNFWNLLAHTLTSGFSHSSSNGIADGQVGVLHSVIPACMSEASSCAVSMRYSQHSKQPVTVAACLAEHHFAAPMADRLQCHQS